MKKKIFQDLQSNTESWSSYLWKYFVISVVFHCLLIYGLLTVPLTTPVVRNFPLKTTKLSPDEKSRTPLTGERTEILAADYKSVSTSRYPEHTGYTAGTLNREDLENTEEIIVEGSRANVNDYNDDNIVNETKAVKSREERDIVPLPAPIILYKYQVPVSAHRLDFDSDQYIKLYVQSFRDARKKPVFAFPVSKPDGFYRGVTTFVEEEQFPALQLSRIEEIIDYIFYDYPLPQDELPFSLTTELAACPWKTGRRLVHIGLQGKIVEIEGAENKINDKTFIVATNIKIEVMFNPDRVKAYRLTAYGHRRPKLRAAKEQVEGKEHRELIMGQSLTTLYEILLIDPVIVDTNSTNESSSKPTAQKEQEIALVKVIYNIPDSRKTYEISQKVGVIEDNAVDNN